MDYSQLSTFLQFEVTFILHTVLDLDLPCYIPFLLPVVFFSLHYLHQVPMQYTIQHTLLPSHQQFYSTNSMHEIFT